MVSGTIAHKRREKNKRAEELRKAKNKSLKNKALKSNREEIITEVCSLFGWKELDPFAKKMIDDAVSGNFVNIKQLKSDIAEWKKSQEMTVTEATTEESAVVEKESVADGDTEV